MVDGGRAEDVTHESREVIDELSLIAVRCCREKLVGDVGPAMRGSNGRNRRNARRDIGHADVDTQSAGAHQVSAIQPSQRVANEIHFGGARLREYGLNPSPQLRRALLMWSVVRRQGCKIDARCRL